MLLRESSRKFSRLKKRRFRSEKEVENIIFSGEKENIFGEELFIIGRHLTFNSIDDELDVLALDKEGNLVVIEAKKTFSSATTADSQALRYASYISNWSLLEIKEATEDYYIQKSNNRINFEKKINDFLDVDLSFVNQNQKIILFGSNHNRKLFSSCGWLQKQGIDIEIFQVEKYTSLESEQFIKIKKINPKIWMKKYSPKLKGEFDKKYHLRSCTRDTAELVEAFVEVINELYSYSGPDWSNQTYIKFLDSEKRINILEVMINQNSIYVNPTYSRQRNFNKSKVKEEVNKKVDFDIKKMIRFR